MPARGSAPAQAVAPRRAGPRLDLRAPLMVGFGALALFVGASVGAAALITSDTGAGLPGTVVVEGEAKSVRHAKGGVVGELHVREGQRVKAGDPLVTLSTTALDDHIAGLKAEADAGRRQLALAREQVQAMSDPAARQQADRGRVAALERTVAAIESEAASLNAKIAVASRELAEARITAPFAGRVATLKVAGPGAVVEPGGSLLTIEPQVRHILVESRVAQDRIDGVKPGMPVKVWLSAQSWRSAPLAGRVTTLSPVGTEDTRGGPREVVARVALDAQSEDVASRMAVRPGMRAHVLLPADRHTLLDQFAESVVNKVRRALRG